MRVLAGVVVVLMLVGCGGTPVVENIACKEPRPSVCTMEYMPVCGTLRAGGVKRHASACNACADDSVVSYVPEACAAD